MIYEPQTTKIAEGEQEGVSNQEWDVMPIKLACVTQSQQLICP